MTVVAVLSMKGGVGKTTVALGLVSAAWDRHLGALVIDLDPQANASMPLEVMDAPFTSSDVLADARPGVAREAIVATGWGRGIDAIRSERSLEHRTSDRSRASSLRLRTALATVPRDYPLVVIDCPPSLGELTRNALSAADTAVVVTEANYFAVHGAAEALEAVDVVRNSSNPSLKSAALVLNRFRPDDREQQLHKAELDARYGSLVFDPPLPECPALPMSQRSCSPIHAWTAPGSSELAATFDDLLDSLLPPVRPARPTPSIRRFFT